MKPSQNRKQTTATYDFLSRWYDLISGPAEARAKQQAVELLGIQPGDRILEIGAGTGSSAVEMAALVGGNGYVFALDLSLKMLQVAQRKRIRRSEASSLGWVCGDAIDLPFTSHSVERVFISFTLELFTDEEIPLLLDECRRVICRGGRLGVLSMSRCQPNAPLISFYEWLHRHFPAWFDCHPILLRQILENYGYKTIAARQSSVFGLPIESVLAEPIF